MDYLKIITYLLAEDSANLYSESSSDSDSSESETESEEAEEVSLPPPIPRCRRRSRVPYSNKPMTHVRRLKRKSKRINPILNKDSTDIFTLEGLQRYDDAQFLDEFHVSRKTYHDMLTLLKRAHYTNLSTAGRQRVSAERVLLMTIWYLAHRKSYRNISQRYQVVNSCAFRIINRCLTYIANLAQKLVRWPEAATIDSQTERNTANGLLLHNSVGAIGACHIPITHPDDKELYANCLDGHSIILQVVVDDTYQFIDVFCGQPGSFENARVLIESPLYHMATDPLGGLGKGQFVVGDASYPQMNWLVPPLVIDNSEHQQEQLILKFNKVHADRLMFVNVALEMLKCRFRRLVHFENKSISFVNNAIIASCVLHNLCVANGDEMVIHEDNTFDVQVDKESKPSVLGTTIGLRACDESS